ncbi:hypothetical protein GCM10010331_38960 [Streptomyces xanthochromogenes]|nr:hypothetical protein GCM10010331_38960 [Streptomyces xanthochromogenes]
MPTVTVQQGPRDVELKRESVERGTDAFVDAYEVPAETVQVVSTRFPRTAGVRPERSPRTSSAARKRVQGRLSSPVRTGVGRPGTARRPNRTGPTEPNGAYGTGRGRT